jgi:hypothetical protein
MATPWMPGTAARRRGKTSVCLAMVKSDKSWGFPWISNQTCGCVYPLVVSHIENHHFVAGKINYFYGHLQWLCECLPEGNPNTKSTQQTLGGKNPTNGNQWNLTRQKHAQTNYMIFDKFAKPWGLQQRTCVF